MAFVNAIFEITRAPTMGGVVLETITFLGPVWIAFLLGIMLGWAWKPRWASFGNCKFDISAPSSPSTSVNPSPVEGFGGAGTPNFGSSSTDNLMEKEGITLPRTDNAISSSLKVKSGESLAVKEDDLEHFCRLVERKDGGPPWKHMMERSTSDMSYYAWQRDPETGPPQYYSRTVYENATPELLRDFFWDDEFRLKWDDMLIHAETVEECPTTGTMIVHWIRKFPFFCSDREYIFGRRIWESGRSYYCVTKGVPYDSIPRRDRPRRVDLFYSSWFIQAVESKKENGQLNACEVILFHHEDMGIPKEITKFGVRQGMWGTVRKIENAVRAYQKIRASGKPISHPAFMAQINSKIDPDYLKSLQGGEVSSETEVACSPEKPRGMNIPKLLVVGGAVIVACSVDQGLLTKTVILSIARAFANIGRKACPRR